MGQKRAGIVLSGCGVYDGSEIHESTLLLLACAQAGIEVQGFSPVMNSVVVNHVSQAKEVEVRNCLVESARIMRGQIKPLEEYKPTDFDALLFPGGFGAVLNLSNFGSVQALDFEVHETVRHVIEASYETKTPMGFLCISPIVAARVLGSTGLKLTLGSDPGYLEKLSSLGAEAVPTQSQEIVWDDSHRVASAPAYMMASSINDVYVETKQMVDVLFSVS